MALWFETADFDTKVQRIRAMGSRIVNEVHVNPNAGHREIWIRDLDGYRSSLTSRMARFLANRHAAAAPAHLSPQWHV